MKLKNLIETQIKLSDFKFKKNYDETNVNYKNKYFFVIRKREGKNEYLIFKTNKKFETHDDNYVDTEYGYKYAQQRIIDIVYNLEK